MLLQLLEKLIPVGHKTLIFSQFTSVLDIIGFSLKLKGYGFCQLDGRTKLDVRQAEVERFYKEPDTTVFLLSTRAGGLGINLIAADTCILYDSDWNPQQDLQAQDRCHRIGQTRPVVIYRLVTQNTIDESIVTRAQAKRSIEKLVVHQDKFKSGISSLKETTQKALSIGEIMSVLLEQEEIEGANKEGAKQGQYGVSEDQLEALLDRTDLVEEWKAKGGVEKKRPEGDVNFNLNTDEACELGIASEEEGAMKDEAESIHECLICERPLVCRPSQLIKVCARPRCRFTKDQLKTKPKVVVNKRAIRAWYIENGYEVTTEEDERVEKFLEKERQRKKKAFYSKLQKNRMNLGEGGNVINLSSSDDETGGGWNFEKELKRLDKNKKKIAHAKKKKV